MKLQQRLYPVGIQTFEKIIYFSLMNAFNDGKLNSYWFGSGTPTYLIE